MKEFTNEITKPIEFTEAAKKFITAEKEAARQGKALPEIYSVEEIAKLLEVTPRTIYNYIYAKQLEAVKIGRKWKIKKDQLDSFLATGTDYHYWKEYESRRS